MARKILLFRAAVPLVAMALFAASGCASTGPATGDVTTIQPESGEYLGPVGSEQNRQLEARRVRLQTPVPPVRRPSDFPAIGSNIEIELEPVGAEPTGRVSAVKGKLVALNDKWVQLRNLQGQTVWVPRDRVILIVEAPSEGPPDR